MTERVIQQNHRETPQRNYINGVQTLNRRFRFGLERSFETTIISPDGRREFTAVLDREKRAAPQRLVVVKMHDDDEAIALHTIKKLADKGVGVFFITVTNGNGRPRDAHTPDEVAEKRRLEGVAAAEKMGVAAYINLDYHDMQVSDRAADIKRTLVPYLRMIDPTMVMTLHPEDHNPDHAAGADIVYDALYRARNTYLTDEIAIPLSQEIPALYYMDPQSLVDRTGQIIPPGIFVKVRKKEKPHLADVVLTYETQYTHPSQLQEFEDRVRERGRPLRWRYGAEGLSQDKKGAFLSKRDILRELLDREVVVNGSKRYYARRVFGRESRPVWEF
ncbi:MAG TPA: PIG-L family deacetylase [Patescibacteria group bacterium]|nr:PIG-L family deacetylase [Patescibacteria group bacterium]